MHPTYQVANTRYGAHTPLTSPVVAQNPGAMLHFQCSCGGNTTDCGEAKAYSGDLTTQSSAKVNQPSAHRVILATKHFTPLTTRCRAQIGHLSALRGGSTKGVVDTS
jgi:hypothetical protein